MKSILVLALFSFSLFNQSETKFLRETKDGPLLVGIYYSPYDDNSIKFFKDQSNGSETGIFDLMLPNTNYLEVNFVPWNIANTETKAYTCADEEDCLATRLHACAIEQHKSAEDGDHQIFHFIVCTMSHENWITNSTQAVVQCINQIGEWPDEGEYINECSKNHTESDVYLAHMKQQAGKAGVAKGLWITINEEQNEKAENDLKTEVCSTIDGTKPNVCLNTNQTTSSTTDGSIPSSTSSSTNEVLNIGIFYSPYDDNSIRFIKDQSNGSETGIFDLMLPNTNYLEVNFVPWNIANTETKAYTCADEEDCLATRLHACAIEQHKSAEDGDHQIFHFIVCTMNNENWKTNSTQAVVQCINQIGEWPDEGEYINECSKNHTESDLYLSHMKEQAEKAKVTKVPWITIAGTPNEKAETDLKTEVCNSFDENKPDACSNTSKPGTSPTEQPGDSGAIEKLNSKIVLSLLISIAIFINFI